MSNIESVFEGVVEQLEKIGVILERKTFFEGTNEERKGYNVSFKKVDSGFLTTDRLILLNDLKTPNGYEFFAHANFPKNDSGSQIPSDVYFIKDDEGQVPENFAQAAIYGFRLLMHGANKYPTSFNLECIDKHEL